MLFAIWAAFVLRGVFYCVEQPMWEGMDEWAHFAYIQQIADTGELPARTDPVSPELQESLQATPLSSAAAADLPGAITYDAFWRLSAAERESRTAARHRITRALQYEAQQPPLYYLAMAPVYRTFHGASLAGRLIAIRIVSMLIASSVVFIGYAIACRVMSWRMALMAAALLACIPGLFIDVCRVANDSLAIALVSCVVLGCFSARGPLGWILLGGVMGAALLTKAYVLAVAPLLILTGLVRLRNQPWRRTALLCLSAYLVALAMAGWWYAETWSRTGSLTGEQLQITAAHVPLTQALARLGQMRWIAAADAAAFTHIWIGAWSFLTVRSWMYRIWEGIAVLGVVGLVLRRPPLIVTSAYLLMVAALVYYSVVMFLARGISTGIGWYLYVVVVPEIVLLCLGLIGVWGQKWSSAAVAAVCILALALDLYTVHFVSMPYYTGLIAHRATGGLESFHVANVQDQMRTMFQRQLVGEASFAVLWAVYAVSTVALGAAAIRLAVRSPSAESGAASN